MQSTMATTTSVNGRKLTRNEVEKFRKIFDSFDTNKSGAIEKQEVKRAMKLAGIQPATDGLLKTLIAEVDTNKNGKVDFVEFCDCMEYLIRHADSEEDEIRQCFDVFDTDGKGQVTQSEFRVVMRDLGGFTDQFIDSLFEENDLTGSGYLDYEEFTNFVRSYLRD